MANNMWELYDGYYLPLGECSPNEFRSLEKTGIDVYTLALAAPGNPYTVFINTVCKVKSLLLHALSPRRKRQPRTDWSNKLELLFTALVDTGRNLCLPDKCGDSKHIPHVVLAYQIEPVVFFQSIVNNVLDNWQDLELEPEGLFNVPDSLGIPRETWIGAWRMCVADMPNRLRTIIRDMPVKEYRKSMPPVDWYKFVQQWGGVFAQASGEDGGIAAVTATGAVPEVTADTEHPQEPQVITDHTITDDVLQEKRVMHATNVSAKLEFILEFETDADVLAACIRLLPRKIGRVWSTDLSVRCNALVVAVHVDSIGSGYPIAESLYVDRLRQVAADVDDLHRRVTMLVKTAELVRGGADLS